MAVSAAVQAGSVLKNFFLEGNSRVTYKEALHPVTEADLAANELILSSIAKSFPGDAIRSEETIEQKKISAPRTWIVDPLDGTQEFINHSPDFCVMIGLTEGTVPILGVIYDPMKSKLFLGVLNEGAWLIEGDQTQILKMAMWNEPPVIVHSKNHRSQKLNTFLKLNAHLKTFSRGSAGLKAMCILENEADIYFHPSSHIKEWDTCAAHAIIRATGGFISDGQGETLQYTQDNPRHQHGILVAKKRPDLLMDMILAHSP